MRHHQAPRPDRLVVLDIETVPDHARIPDSQTGRFPKPIYHAIACISFVEASITIDADGYERSHDRHLGSEAAVSLHQNRGLV